MRSTHYMLGLLIWWATACQSEKERLVTAEEIAQSDASLERANSTRQGSTAWYAHLDTAIQLNPNNATAWREKSVWYTKTGDYAKAYALLDRAVELDPMDALGYRGWLKLYKTHNYQGAIEDLMAFQALHQETSYPWGENVYYLIGTAHLGMGEYDEAISYLDKCINEVTEESGEKWVDVYAWINRGIAYMELGDISAARKDFQKTLQYAPQCPEAFFYLAKSYFEEGNRVEGCQHLSECRRLFDAGYSKGDPYKDFNFQVYGGEIRDLAFDEDCELQ